MTNEEAVLIDLRRAASAAGVVVAGREKRTNEDQAAIITTLEHTIAVTMLTLYGNPELASYMLNEVVLMGVEEKLLQYAAEQRNG